MTVEDALLRAAPQHEDPLRRRLRDLAHLWDTAAEDADRAGKTLYAAACRTCDGIDNGYRRLRS